MYRSGIGVPVDNLKAYVWLNVAAAQGVPGAAPVRDAVLSRLSAAE
jgi:TPR repeat protein